MAVLPLLADPDNYRAHTIDMMGDDYAYEYWVDVFDHHLNDSLVDRAIESANGLDNVAERAEAMRQRFMDILQQVRQQRDVFGPLNIMLLCDLRERCLREQGFDDAYRVVKARETEAALEHLPALLAELDAMGDAERCEALIVGIFAGNLFDLGTKETVKMFNAGQMDFHRTRRQVMEKPWVDNGLERWQARWVAGPYRKAVVLVDNAGADIVLGMLPFVRELTRRGTHVVLSPNDEPALNDITVAELGPLLERVAAMDPVMAEAMQTGRLELIGSGNDSPLIDLRRISDALAEASADADLLVIEGMGRALETNYHTPFRCDTLKVAMIKEQHVAQVIGGQMYDVVCKFQEVTE